MSKITVKALTYAKYSAGGDGSSITYTGGKQKTDYLCRAELTEQRSSVKEHADGRQIDSDNILTGVQLALELANNDDDIKKDILGFTTDDGDLIATGDDAPYVGIGYVLANRFKRTVTYEARWVYKMQFSRSPEAVETRRDQTAFQHETINGDGEGCVFTAGGKTWFYAEKNGMTEESLATEWLKTKAQISG